MATSEDKQELIEDIKRPIRHYRIKLFGYGIEGVWGNSSKEEFNYWNDKEARCEQMDLDEDKNPFEVYMFEKEDDIYSFVPEHLRREGEWYEQDEVDHVNGVEFSSAYIEIIEVDSNSYKSNTVKEICSYYLVTEMCDELDIMNTWGDVNTEDYYFQGISFEKGQFFDGVLSTNGKIDLSLIKFHITECPTNDEIITDISYGEGDNPSNWKDIDNEGGDSNSKGLYIELVDSSIF